MDDNSNNNGHLWLSLLFLAMTFASKENCAFSVVLLNVIMIFVYPISPAKRRTKYEQKQMQFHCGATQTKSQFYYNHCGAQRRLLISKITFACLLMLMTRIAITWLSFIRTTTTLENTRNFTTCAHWTLVPKFSHLDNPLIQSEHQFCLRNNGNGQCANDNTLSELRRSMLLTRLRMPFEALKLIFWPTKLSYDWPLNSLGGLIASPMDARFVVAFSCYLTILTFLARQLISKWNLAKLHLFIIFRIHSEDFLKEEKKSEQQQQHLISAIFASHKDFDLSDSETNSETSSMKSVKTSDSGIELDNQSSTSSSRNESPEPTINNNNNQSSSTSALSNCINNQFDNHQNDNYLLSFQGWSFLWLLVNLLPSINFLWNVGFLLAERVLYMASLGFCLLAGQFIVQMSDFLAAINKSSISKKTKEANRRTNKLLETQLIIPSPLVLLISFGLLFNASAKVVWRNFDWASEMSLFESNLSESPAKSLSNLASIQETLVNREDLRKYDQQSSLYRKALELEPHSADLHYNLALALQHERDIIRSNQGTNGNGIDRDNRAELEQEFEYAAGNLATTNQLTSDTDRGRDRDDIIEMHYKLALKLRPNFALASLNLANYWATKEQSVVRSDPMRLLVHCAISMGAGKSRSFAEHVQAQIECLISGARLCLRMQNKQQYQQRQQQDDDNNDTMSSSGSSPGSSSSSKSTSTTTTPNGKQDANRDPDWRQHFEARPQVDESSRMASLTKSETGQTSKMGIAKQTTACNHHRSSPRKQLHEPAESGKFAKLMQELGADSENIDIANILNPKACSQFEWLELALAKASQIQGFNTKRRKQSDLNKQMALIHWLAGQLDYRQAGKLFKLATEFAVKSGAPIEAQIYLSSLDKNPTKAISELRHFIERESAKRPPKYKGDLARLHHQLAKLLLLKRNANSQSHLTSNVNHLRDSREATDQLRKALEWEPENPDLLAELAHQAYLGADFNFSESLYARVLNLETTLAREDKIWSSLSDRSAVEITQRRRLTKAHTNLGAILQVQGKLNEALKHYKEALAISLDMPKFDLSRRIAETNLKILEDKMDLQHEEKNKNA